MTSSTVFTSNRSQAVRLPKEFRFKEGEVGINRIGDLVILYPRKKGWEVLEKSLDAFTGDFMEERRQPKKPERRKAR